MHMALCVPDVPINNQRYTCLQFGVKDSTLLHGFAGYFESLLYKDIMLSELRLSPRSIDCTKVF